MLNINGMPFDETNDGTIQLEAEDNSTSITLDVILMSIQDQVIHYLTTNATNGNEIQLFYYYIITAIIV